MPKVSVIVPNYNHANYLRQRIDSILNQTFQDFELILLDDCSTDNSVEVLNEYANHPKVKQLVFNETNSGSTFRQWNKGLVLAQGEYIWMAESDDYCEPTFLESLISSMALNLNIKLAYAQSYDVDESGNIIESRLKWTDSFNNNIWTDSFVLSGEEILDYFIHKNVIPNVSAAIFDKKIVLWLIESENIGSYKMLGDWYLWVMLTFTKDCRIAFLNEHLNYFRASQQSTRNHNDFKKKQTRLLEEAWILYWIQSKNAALTSIVKKQSELRIKWYNLADDNKKFNSFFAISEYFNASKVPFLLFYIFYAFRKRLVFLLNKIK